MSFPIRTNVNLLLPTPVCVCVCVYIHKHTHTYIHINFVNYCAVYILFFFAVALRPNAGHGPLILEVSRLHTTTHHSRQDSSGRVISSSQRTLSDNTQHSQQTSMPPVP
jgi:hypothetical protein